MRLSINLVHHGCYVKAGDPLPADFVLPLHLETFAIYDENSQQTSRAGDPRFFAGETSGGSFGVGARPAKPATDYSEGEEEFAPKFVPIRTKAKERKKL